MVISRGLFENHTHREFECLRVRFEIISKTISLENQQGTQQVPEATAEQLAEIARPAPP